MDLNPAIQIIKEFEGCELKAYRDGAGVLTIGYGHTEHVFDGEEITQQQAEDLLLEDVQRIGAYPVEHLVKVPINENQFSALVSFTFNCGGGSLASSTMLRLLNAGAPALEVADELPKWVHDIRGHVEPGLVRRRAFERALFLKPIGELLD